MPDKNYNTGNGLTTVEPSKGAQGRKPTVEEAEAILTLVLGGWLNLELTVSEKAEL